MAAVLLAAVIFLFDDLREERSGPLAEESGVACFKTPRGSAVPLEAHPWKVTERV